MLNLFFSRNFFCFQSAVSEAYPIVCYVLQNESSGTTRLLRIKVIEGVNLAKKDIFGARYEVFSVFSILLLQQTA